MIRTRRRTHERNFHFCGIVIELLLLNRWQNNSMCSSRSGNGWIGATVTIIIFGFTRRVHKTELDVSKCRRSRHYHQRLLLFHHFPILLLFLIDVRGRRRGVCCRRHRGSCCCCLHCWLSASSNLVEKYHRLTCRRRQVLQVLVFALSRGHWLAGGCCCC